MAAEAEDTRVTTAETGKGTGRKTGAPRSTWGVRVSGDGGGGGGFGGVE